MPDSRLGVGHLSALAEHRTAPVEGKAVRGAPFCQLGVGKGIRKVMQLESDLKFEPQSKPVFCCDLLPVWAPFFKSQDAKGHGTHQRKVIVDTAFLVLLGASRIWGYVINASGVCDEFLWKCKAKERFSFLESCVFSEDENHLIHSFLFLACYQEAPTLASNSMAISAKVIMVYAFSTFYILWWNFLFYCIHICCCMMPQSFLEYQRRI